MQNAYLGVQICVCACVCVCDRDSQLFHPETKILVNSLFFYNQSLLISTLHCTHLKKSEKEWKRGGHAYHAKITTKWVICPGSAVGLVAQALCALHVLVV